MTAIFRKTQSTPLQLSFELIAAFTLSSIYFYGIALLCRKSIAIEILICLVFPLAAYSYKRSVDSVYPRVIQLIMVESTFMLFVIASKISILSGHEEVCRILGFGFRSLFIIQFFLFMLHQNKMKTYFGALRTLMFLILVIPWLSSTSLSGTIDSHGRYFFSGTHAPTYILVYYCSWVAGILFVDSKTLPNFITAALHCASVFIALLSQEFFHIRLLTACHLFILDYLLSYSKPNGSLFGIMNDDLFQSFRSSAQPIINNFTLTSCLIIFIYAMTGHHTLL